jgi:alcohol dehydrogenase
VEVVLGIGGGSALDAGKAIAGLLRTRTRVRDHLEGLGATVPYSGPAVPFVAVPTTAGTGSEATRNAVLTERGPEGFKRSFRDERLVAVEAVVDPDLLAGAPPDLIAANGMDAVTQLLEALVSSRAGPITDALALAGLTAARDGLVAWHGDPEGERAPAARSAMSYAALLSGICLANAGLGAVHGLASPLGALFPIPHGAACGALLPATVKANISALEARAPDSPALAKYEQVARLLEAPVRPLADTLRAWQRGLGIRPLGEFGVAERDIPRIVADSRGSSMRTNPVSLTSEEIASILRASL